MNSHSIVVLAAGVLVFGCSPSLSGLGEVAGDVHALSKKLETAHCSVGFVVGVSVEGEQWIHGYGEAVRGSGRAPGPRTLYKIGSVTKIFTGILLADACLRGEVQLDDPVNQYLPTAPFPDHESGPVRLRHLITHTAGLPRMPANFTPAHEYSLEQMYEAIGDMELPTAPGEVYRYSNMGSELIGVVLARAADRPYADLLQERILSPLGMDDTCIAVSEECRARVAPPYGIDQRPEREWRFAGFPSATSLYSTVADMLLFAGKVVDPPPGPAGAALRESQRVLFTDPETHTSVAYGWNYQADPPVLHHDGATAGYGVTLAIEPGARRALVALTNCRVEEMGGLARYAWALVQGRTLDGSPQWLADARQ